MIRRNVASEEHNESPSRRTATREFTVILTVLKPFWFQYVASPETYVAQGLLATKRGIVRMASVSFDEKRRYMRLLVQLPLRSQLDTPRLYALLQLQNRTLSLASLVFDAEHRMLLLVSRSVLPSPNTAGEVVAQVVADALNILDDEDVNRLVD